MTRTYDYIVVGAGSAGCALASRLSERPDLRILLIEAGGRDRHHWIRIPIGIGKILDDERFVWRYETEGEPHLDDRKLYWPHGRLLGGSSSVNGMLFVRGERSRYDQWSEAGCPGWSYSDLLPVFKKLEDSPRRRSGLPRHRRPGHRDPDRYRRSRVPRLRAGLPGSRPSGQSRLQRGADRGCPPTCQLNTRRGLRCSSARAFLYPALKRRNLEVRCNAVGTATDHVRQSSVRRRRVLGWGGDGSHCTRRSDPQLRCIALPPASGALRNRRWGDPPQPRRRGRQAPAGRGRKLARSPPAAHHVRVQCAGDRERHPAQPPACGEGGGAIRPDPARAVGDVELQGARVHAQQATGGTRRRAGCSVRW